MTDSMAQVGVDLGGTKMLVVARTGAERRQWRFATGPDATAEEIRARVEGVLEEVGARVAGTLGLAVPGLIDAGGVVRDCDVLPRLKGWEPKAIWPQATVLNDGEAALVRAAQGEAPEATVVAIGCGTGLVAALQAGGGRLRQWRPYAGELGYVPCGFGATFDELASGASIVRAVGTGAAEIHERLERGDEEARRVVRAAGEAFGLSLVTVLHLLHPEKIGVYGGTLRYAGYWEAARGVYEQRALPALVDGCRLERMAEEELVVAEGALIAARQGK